MKKKILALALAGVTMCVFAGCQKNDNSDARELKDYSEYITLGEYTDLEIEVGNTEATDEQLQEKIDEIIKARTTYEQITDRTVTEEDTINFDYSGIRDGEAFDGGTATGVTYTIGGNLISDLNDQLVGLECGKEYDLECTFPEDYSSNPDLAGVTVTFVVTVNYIQGDAIVPEWTDDFINDYSEGSYTTTADYEAYLKDTIKTQNESTQKNTYQAALWATILDNATINGYPQERVDEYYQEVYEYYQSIYGYYASLFGLDGYEAYLEQMHSSDEELQEFCMEYVKSDLEYTMAAVEISKAAGITVSNAEYESKAQEFVEKYEYEDIAALEEAYGQDYLVEYFLFAKVDEWVQENNKMVETDVPIASETEGETADAE